MTSYFITVLCLHGEQFVSTQYRLSEGFADGQSANPSTENNAGSMYRNDALWIHELHMCRIILPFQTSIAAAIQCSMVVAQGSLGQCRKGMTGQ